MNDSSKALAAVLASSGTGTAARAQDHVSATRLNDSIAALAAFGGRADGGVARETLTAIDLQARRYLIDRARAIGCEVEIDACANLFFRRAGRAAGAALPAVLTGSHIDTQPVGGKLDGAYGVLAGLEVLEALNDAHVETLRSIEVVAWTNEEGSRFGPGAMGSSAFVDPSRLAGYRSVLDGENVSFGAALDAALAAVPDVPRRPLGTPLAACVELHIEQGPVLERARVPLAVVSAIQGVRWYRVHCAGAAAHAGTTPMSVRRDAMAAAVDIASRLYALAAQFREQGLLLTLGRWRVAPNSINTVPGQAEFTIDVRCPDDELLGRFDRLLAELIAMPCMHADVSHETIFSRATTRFPAPMLERLERACARAISETAETIGTGARAALRMTSGAFHDAMYLAEHCPTAMLFVPSKDGVSHNAAEYTDPHELFLGARALAHAVTELAESGEI